jgi:hypothetical protein
MESVAAPATLGERFRMEQGAEIHDRARTLYPHGILVGAANNETASAKTTDLINNLSASVIFEGTFLVDGYVAKADILKRIDSGWQMIEVKSSANDKPEFIDDMAYTFMVIARSGLNIQNASLMLVSKDFRLGMGNEELFVELSHTDEVQDRAATFEPFWEPVEEETRSPISPKAVLRFECRGCALFRECLGKNIENHVFEIPRLSASKFEALKQLSVVRIEDIPSGFPLTEHQSIVRQCVQRKTQHVGHELKAKLQAISWPAYYLDFETVMTAIPLYPDIAPYTQLPTQYSICKCSEPGRIVDSIGYLADPAKDCRQELARNLINDLQGKGSIIIYSNFDKAIVNNLGVSCQDLGEELNLITDRMVNLEAIIRSEFYHPNFHGSTSIKVTLPVLAPNMSYDDLKITDGDTAMATFAYLALNRYKAEEIEGIRKSLEEYCMRDSLALVKLHEQLVKYI